MIRFCSSHVDAAGRHRSGLEVQRRQQLVESSALANLDAEGRASRRAFRSERIGVVSSASRIFVSETGKPVVSCAGDAGVSLRRRRARRARIAVNSRASRRMVVRTPRVEPAAVHRLTYSGCMDLGQSAAVRFRTDARPRRRGVECVRRLQRAKEARMHQVLRADQIELADAIAEGAKRRPSQAFGEYFSDQGRIVRARRGLRRRLRAAAGSRLDPAAARSPVRLPRERPPPLPRRLQQAAAAERDHPAPERRSSLDARADRQLAPEVAHR